MLIPRVAGEEKGKASSYERSDPSYGYPAGVSALSELT